MARMISDLLDLTRVRQGVGLPVVPAPMDLREVCAQVLDEIAVAYPARRAELVADVDCRGEWDRDRIAQVVSNLVVNALEYSPPETRVRVELGCADPQRVTLAVHNAGPPIEPATIATLFDPFKRGAASATSAPRKGLGLGLFIAREIVRAHGGSIDVRSDAPEGTTFTVSVPRAPPRRID